MLFLLSFKACDFQPGHITYSFPLIAENHWYKEKIYASPHNSLYQIVNRFINNYGFIFISRFQQHNNVTRH